MELWMVTTISSHWPLSPWRRILSHQHPLFVKLIRDSGLDPQTISRFGSFKNSVRFDQLILAHHSSGQAPPSQGQKVGVSSPRGEKGDRFFFLKNGKSCGHVSWIFLGGWLKDKEKRHPPARGNPCWPCHLPQRTNLREFPDVDKENDVWCYDWYVVKMYVNIYYIQNTHMIYYIYSIHIYIYIDILAPSKWCCLNP